jgi:formate hydrogenlyase transcriptional activator
MEAFISYPWPGNVRELQNLIERAVILSSEGILPNPLLELQPALIPVIALDRTFRDSERSLILRALQATGWVVGGPHGAAARLALKRTTLIAKMKRLGISRPTGKTDIGGLSEPKDSPQSYQSVN